jgi:FtsZ-interacting cell division protein ZipA
MVGDIVNAAFLLHNFLIDERERCGSHKEDAAFFNSFSLREQDHSRRNAQQEDPSAVATDNNEPLPRGRPNIDVVNGLKQANDLRERLLSDLTSAGLGRRYSEGMKFNEYGQVYF